MNTTVGCSDMAFQGWHLLRKCNLTKEQRQLINLRAPQLEKKKVIEALYLVLGQDHRAASGPLLERRWQGKGHRGRSYNVQDEYVDDEISEAWDESGYYEWDPSPSHHDEAEYYEDPELLIQALHTTNLMMKLLKSIPGMTWNHMTRHMQHTWRFQMSPTEDPVWRLGS